MKFEIEYSEYLKLVAEIKAAKLSASDRLKIETEAAYLHFAKYRTEASMSEVRGLLGMAVKAAKNASKKPVKQRKAPQTRQTKSELKNPCPGQCGGKNSRFRFPDGKLGRLCPACHKAGKKAERVPMSILRPAAKIPLVFEIRNAFADLPDVVLPAKPKVGKFDKFLSNLRFEEAKKRFRREGRKPRHTGKTAQKRAAKAYRRQCELAAE